MPCFFRVKNANPAWRGTPSCKCNYNSTCCSFLLWVPAPCNVPIRITFMTLTSTSSLSSPLSIANVSPTSISLSRTTPNLYMACSTFDHVVQLVTYVLQQRFSSFSSFSFLPGLFILNDFCEWCPFPQRTLYIGKFICLTVIHLSLHF